MILPVESLHSQDFLIEIFLRHFEGTEKVLHAEVIRMSGWHFPANANFMFFWLVGLDKAVVFESSFDDLNVSCHLKESLLVVVLRLLIHISFEPPKLQKLLVAVDGSLLFHALGV